MDYAKRNELTDADNRNMLLSGICFSCFTDLEDGRALIHIGNGYYKRNRKFHWYGLRLAHGRRFGYGHRLGHWRHLGYGKGYRKLDSEGDDDDDDDDDDRKNHYNGRRHGHRRRYGRRSRHGYGRRHGHDD